MKTGDCKQRGGSQSNPPPKAVPVVPLLGLVSFVLTVLLFKVNWLFFLGLARGQNEKEKFFK